MFKVILLDHNKIDAGDLHMMQYGGFDARVKRIKTALSEGKYWWHDVEAASKVDVQEVWAKYASEAKERLVQTGDTVIDTTGKVWMLDHTGWENVTKQLAKSLNGEIEMLTQPVDKNAPKSVHPEGDRNESDQEKQMTTNSTNGVATTAATSDEVVMLPPAEDVDVTDGDDGEEEVLEAKPAPKKRGRKPGSKNKVKAAPAAPKKAKKKAAVKASAKTAKATKKAAKATGKRRKGVVGVKAQTQIEKEAMNEIHRRAKDQDCTAADIVRAFIYKGLGYKPQAT